MAYFFPLHQSDWNRNKLAKNKEAKTGGHQISSTRNLSKSVQAKKFCFLYIKNAPKMKEFLSNFPFSVAFIIFVHNFR